MDPRTRNGRFRLREISADAFVSPRDQAALENLKRLPLLPVVVRRFNELAVERLLYVQSSAESVRCGPRQFPTLYWLLREACDILDVAEPELYIRQSPMLNGFTAGVTRTFVVLNSAVMNEMEDSELLFVLGHELGHIKCGHVLYGSLGRMLIPLLEVVGDATLGLGKLAGLGLLSAFYEWMRQAEFSCDRAGLLACQDPRGAFSATMKIGCGASRFSGEMDVDAFLEQARSHVESPTSDTLARALMFVLYNWSLDHPQVVFRARELDEWVRGGHYARILSGDYARTAGSAATCPACGAALAASGPCPFCAGREETV